MTIVKNDKLIESRARIGRIAGLAGMGVLVLGLILSFQATPDRTEFFYGSYVALIVGIIISSIGIYNADKWLKEPRADQSLATTLKGLDNKNRLYSYLLPAEHVLLSPLGLTVFKVKRHEGQIECQGDRWRHRQSFWRAFSGFSRERLGNPSRELQYEMEKLSQLIGQKLPDTPIPLDGLVVFSSPKAELNIQDCPVPVVALKQLKGSMRKAGKDSRMSESVRRELERVLDEVAGV